LLLTAYKFSYWFSLSAGLIMKTVLVVLFAFGLVLLCVQSDAKRFLLEEVTNSATDVKPNNQPEKSSTNGNPISGSVPTVVGNNANSEDDKNENYGNYGNPSGSSTETHHVYVSDCQPTKKNC
jgi:hypothetical protein